MEHEIEEYNEANREEEELEMKAIKSLDLTMKHVNSHSEQIGAMVKVSS